MLKLTRLNRAPVAVNPDHISWIDMVPDTTICLIGGDKLIVRETVDELIEQLIEYRRIIRASPVAAITDIDLPPPDLVRGLRRTSVPPPASAREPGRVHGRIDHGREGR